MWKCGLDLRDYQIECLNAVDEAFRRSNSVLISIATGGGKTVIFNTYAVNKKYRTLVIAHRDELLEQAVEKLRLVEFSKSRIPAGFIRSGEWNIAPYTVASIQSLYKNLDRLDGKDFDLVVWDETHHIASPTYRETFQRLISTNPKIKMLGVTATPFRTDGQSLKEFFSECAYSIDTLELIRRGYLVPLKGRIISLPVNLDAVKVFRTADGIKDFSLSQLDSVFNNDEVNSLIVKKWLEYGENRKTIFYLSSLEHAKVLADLFNSAGVCSAFVHGKLSMKERREILRRFKEGEIKILTNMNVLTEGFDDPEVECIALVRPTQSLVLYAQIIGRGLRIAPKKKDCLVLDYTGISTKHSVIGLPDLFGIEDEQLRKRMEEGEPLQIGAVEENGERTIKILIGEETCDFDFEGKEANKYATVIGETIVLTAGRGKTLVMEKEGELYTIYLYHKEKKKVLKKGITEDYAWTVLSGIWKNVRDEFISEYSGRALEEEPTERQRYVIEKAVRIGMLKKEHLPEKINKMDATNIISYLFAKGLYASASDVVLEKVATEDGIRFIDGDLSLTSDEVLCLLGCGCRVTVYRKEGSEVKYAQHTFDSIDNLKTRKKARKLSEDLNFLKNLLKKTLPYKAFQKVQKKKELAEEREKQLSERVKRRGLMGLFRDWE
jgi:superfamily II DNA or RNA helicase